MIMPLLGGVASLSSGLGPQCAEGQSFSGDQVFRTTEALGPGRQSVPSFKGKGS